jgi:hypothetical protein
LAGSLDLGNAAKQSIDDGSALTLHHFKDDESA